MKLERLMEYAITLRYPPDDTPVVGHQANVHEFVGQCVDVGRFVARGNADQHEKPGADLNANYSVLLDGGLRHPLHYGSQASTAASLRWPSRVRRNTIPTPTTAKRNGAANSSAMGPDSSGPSIPFGHGHNTRNEPSSKPVMATITTSW